MHLHRAGHGPALRGRLGRAYGPRDADGRLGPPPGDAKALERLGYTIETAGKNFSRRVPFGPDGDVGRVADLMLRMLHDGFGVTVPVTLTIRAPKGQRSRGTPPVCEAPATS